MTKQELINTYDSMSMPEEHVEAIEARLKKLYDNPSPSSAPEVPEESTREYKFDRKKPSAVKAAVISISAAAAAVLLVFGGRYLINGLPISSDPPLDAETEETSEPPYDTEEIRFESGGRHSRVRARWMLRRIRAFPDPWRGQRQGGSPIHSAAARWEAGFSRAHKDHFRELLGRNELHRIPRGNYRVPFRKAA